MLIWYKLSELARLQGLEEEDVELEKNRVRCTVVGVIFDQSTVAAVVFDFLFLGIDARNAPAHCKYNIYHC